MPPTPTTIACDIDGTLIVKNSIGEDVPNYPVIYIVTLLRRFFKCKIYFWSGSGVDYTSRWIEKLDLASFGEVIAKGQIRPDIAIDDAITNIGQINLQYVGSDHFRTELRDRQAAKAEQERK